jgi:hypothetical protein
MPDLRHLLRSLSENRRASQRRSNTLLPITLYVVHFVECILFVPNH